MTDPEERIVEIEERAERGWYMPSDVAHLLEVARAARGYVEKHEDYSENPSARNEKAKWDAYYRLRDTLHREGEDE